jgi:hypothetical protein
MPRASSSPLFTANNHAIVPNRAIVRSLHHRRFCLHPATSGKESFIDLPTLTRWNEMFRVLGIEPVPRSEQHLNDMADFVAGAPMTTMQQPEPELAAPIQRGISANEG